MQMHSAQYSYRAWVNKARASPRSAWLLHVFTALAGLLSAVRAESRARRACTELARLDHRMHREIGVSRNEIRSLLWRSLLSGQATQLGWRRRSDHGAGNESSSKPARIYMNGSHVFPRHRQRGAIRELTPNHTRR